MTDQAFLTEGEAAEMLRISKRTLQRWRVYPPKNPVPFLRLGKRIVYDRQAIIDWAQRSLETAAK